MSQNMIEQRLSALEARVAKLEGAVLPPVVQRVSAPKKISAKEFLMTKALKAETDKIIALGYYLEHTEGMPLFNVDDLTNVFQAAKEKRPSNINDVVNRSVARGMLMEAPEKKDSKKAWVLTSTGEKYVEGELNK